MAGYRRGATTLFRNQARAYRFFSIIPCVKKESNRRAEMPAGCFVMDFKYQRTTLIVFAPMRTRNMPWLPSATLCSVAAVLS